MRSIRSLCTSAAGGAATTARRLGLERHGVFFDGPVYHNLTYPQIAHHQDTLREGQRTRGGVFACRTGAFTGRSPNDKYIVRQAPSQDDIWWGEVNQPCSPRVFRDWHRRIGAHYRVSADRLYVLDAFCGARRPRKVRFVTELAWQHHFVKNMFIVPDAPPDPDAWDPDFTVLNGCRATHPSPQQDRLNSECFVGFNIEQGLGLIGGTWYGGEMKKGLFSMMNYWLPAAGVLPMHCAANVGAAGDVALFFGLSGTGKTTLSADPHRDLIGDDEHGWDDSGVFNFEGGCYAKTVGLTPETEPEIHAAIRPNALLENVPLDGESGEPDFNDVSITENGRVSYPLAHMPRHARGGTAGHPRHIFFLTCDATGVLPPVAVLDEEQAMYHFLSGYTAKVAGTERGVREPTATFSACFGAAFLPRHPSAYACLLREKMREHGARVYLVNTGWSGGGAGRPGGARMDLETTRACIQAVLDGRAAQSPSEIDPVFGFRVPTDLGENVPSELLTPRAAWACPHAYDQAAHALRARMEDHARAVGGPADDV